MGRKEGNEMSESNRFFGEKRKKNRVKIKVVRMKRNIREKSTNKFGRVFGLKEKYMKINQIINKM